MNGKTSNVSPPDPRLASSKLRWLFLGVCGFLLALLALSGVLAIRLVRQIHAQQLTVTHALSERAQMLSELLLAIQKYNQAVQQFVADARADQEQTARRQLDQLTLEIDADLKQYPGDRDSTEAALVNGLQDVFSQQRTVYISVLGARPHESSHPNPPLTAQHLHELQDQILGWSGRLKAWNGEQLQRADRSLTLQFGSVESGLTGALAIGFGSGFLLVLAGMAYIVRLERQTHRRYIELVKSQSEMQKLSARLLDAQETERRNISRELHDEIGQALGVLLVEAGRLSKTLVDEPPEVRVQIENMKSIAERTVQDVRNMALLLRPSMLDDLGLVAALEWQGREVSRHSEIEVDVRSEAASDDLPDEYRICIYRLVQEALNNAVRHSGARNATVTVRESAKSVVVEVIDDGRGFNAQRTRGLGILGMEERVKRLGGTFTIVSEPDRGVIVSAELPLPPKNGRPS